MIDHGTIKMIPHQLETKLNVFFLFAAGIPPPPPPPNMVSSVSSGNDETYLKGFFFANFQNYERMFMKYLYIFFYLFHRLDLDSFPTATVSNLYVLVKTPLY